MQKSEREPASTGGLLVLTGASHTGKTSVAEALARLWHPSLALLSVDSIVLDTLVSSEEDPWREGIPLAYELIGEDLAVLLRRDWMVILESTFTYVPKEGEPQLHLDRLSEFVALADELGKPAVVAQLSAPREVIVERAKGTGRLPREIVEKTVELHEAAPFPPDVIRLESGDRDPAAIAAEILFRAELR